jgi:septal ring factor EnvC (AmiA/AmiB activator)
MNRKKTPERKSAAAVLQHELLLLGQVLEEISRNYINRLQREIQLVGRAVEDVEQKGEFTRRQLKDLKQMSASIRGLHVKAEKGRRKDLKKIDELIGELEAFTENW